MKNPNLLVRGALENNRRAVGVVFGPVFSRGLYETFLKRNNGRPHRNRVRITWSQRKGNPLNLFNQCLKDVSGRSPLHRTDSFRKVLPSKPSATVDSRLSMSMKMIERPVVNEGNNRGNKMFSPYFLEYAIMAEYLMLQKQELTGIYVIPSDVDPLVWFGVIFIRQGIYEGGIFRFQVHFPDDFPDGPCPKIIFESDVFHPAINVETGELNVSEEFKEWKRTVNHVWQVLQYTGRIFYRIDVKNAANKVASELFTKDNEKFKKLVKLCVEESQVKVHQKPTNDDPNYFKFEPYSESLHETVRKQIALQMQDL